MGIQKTERFIFFSFLLIYVIYMLFLIQNLSLWGDEDCSLHTSSGSLINALKLSYTYEGQPPVYFLILTIWRKINETIFFARILSLVFTLLSAYLLNKTVRYLFNDIYSRWLIVLFLLNPFIVWTNLQIRLYSLIVFLAISLIYCFYKIYIDNNTRYRILFVIIGILAVYTQYYFIFLIITMSFILLINHGWRIFLNFVLLATPIALLFLPNLLYIKDQFDMHHSDQIVYTVNDRLTNILTTPQNFLFNINDVPFGKVGRWIVRIFFCLIFIFSLFKLYQNKSIKPENIKNRIIEICTFIITIFFIFLIVFLLTNLIYTDRYLAIAFPLFCMLFVVIGLHKPLVKNIIYGIIALYFGIFTLVNYKSPYVEDFDFRSLVKYVNINESSNEPILFYDKILLLPFSNYYKGSNELIPIPELKFDFNYYKNNIKDTIEFEQIIKSSTNDPKSMLLITGNDLGFVEKLTLNNSILDRYIKNNYLVSIDTVFPGKKDIYNLRIRRITKKQLNSTDPKGQIQ